MDIVYVLKKELKKTDVDIEIHKENALSLVFYKFACEEYEIDKKYWIENIAIAGNEEMINLLKEGINEIVKTDEDDKQRFDVFHDIFDLIDFENTAEIVEIIKALNTISTTEYMEIFDYKNKNSSHVFKQGFDLASKILSKIITNEFSQVKTLYNPNCDYADFIIQLNKIANLEKVFAAQEDFENYIISKMKLLVNGFDYDNIHVKNFNPCKENLFDEKFQVSASIMPIKGRKDENYDADYEAKYIEDSINHIEDDGLIGIVVSNRMLYSNKEVNFREKLIEKGCVSAIINISQDYFKDRGSSILILKKNNENVLFINVKTNHSQLNRMMIVSDKEINEAIEIYHNRLDKKYQSRLVSLDEIRDNKFNLNLSRYIDTNPQEAFEVFESLTKIDEINNKIKILDRKIGSKADLIFNSRIADIKKAIETGNVVTGGNFNYGGVNVIVTDDYERYMDKKDEGRDLYIYTKHSTELSELFGELVAKFGKLYGPQFYRFIGYAAASYLENNPDGDDSRPLLRYVVELVEMFINKFSTYTDFEQGLNEDYQMFLESVLAPGVFERHVRKPISKRKIPKKIKEDRQMRFM